MRELGKYMTWRSCACVCLATFALGCAGNRVSEAEQIAHRQETGEGCATANVQTKMLDTPAKFIEGHKSVRPTVRGHLYLQCPATYQFDDAYIAECRASVEAVLAVINNEQSIPVTMAQVRFNDEGGCIDTFRSGCEAWDCSSWMGVYIPMRQN